MYFILLHYPNVRNIKWSSPCHYCSEYIWRVTYCNKEEIPLPTFCLTALLPLILKLTLLSFLAFWCWVCSPSSHSDADSGLLPLILMLTLISILSSLTWLFSSYSHPYADSPLLLTSLLWVFSPFTDFPLLPVIPMLTLISIFSSLGWLSPRYRHPYSNSYLHPLALF